MNSSPSSFCAILTSTCRESAQNHLIKAKLMLAPWRTHSTPACRVHANVNARSDCIARITNGLRHPEDVRKLIRGTVTLVSLTLVTGLAQSTTERPTFDVASIKMYPGGNGFQANPDGLRHSRSRLRARVDFFRKNNIAARAAGPVPQAQLKRMTQALVGGSI